MLTMTPEQTEGPFYPRILPVDSDNDLVQVRGWPARAMGTVLHLQGRVLDGSGVARAGRYDGRDLAVRFAGPVRSSAAARPRAARRGLPGIWLASLTDATAATRFRTLKPVAYPGRTPHIHLKVDDSRRPGGLRASSIWRAIRGTRGDFVYVRQSAGIRAIRRVIEMRLEPRQRSGTRRLYGLDGYRDALESAQGLRVVYLSPMSLGTALPSCGRPMAW